jgi:hypothetical protein
MSSVNNINNNNYVVNVGRTTPVDPGPQPASKSIPVVVSTDQEALPVVEQNKILSEVSLSLLGIPRAEVALGIFADVNTYDVNPSEWSSEPAQRKNVAASELTAYTDIPGRQTTGISHLPEESGALVEAGADETAVLTSKRFFRYQPGRVSAATFGIKSSTAVGALSTTRSAVRNPTIKKYGIFDKFDGYYWETRDTAQGDQFAVVRRTQSIIRSNPLEFGNGQLDDYALAGKPPASTPTLSISFTAASKSLTKGRFTIVENAITNPSPGKTYYDTLDTTNKAKCERDMDLAIDAYVNDLRYGGDGYTSVNATTYRTADGNNGVGEAALHDALTAEIKTYLDALGETVASAKTDTLGAITSTAAGGVQPTIANINWPTQQSKLTVIKTVYRKYLGYLVSVSQTYDTSDYADLNYTDVAAYEKVLKYKCLRDVKFAVDAYFDDLSGQGNAATIYNAKRYYFLDDNSKTSSALQVYSQTDSNSVIAEVARHEYLKKLLVGDPTAGLADGTQVAVEVAGSVTATIIDSVVDLFDVETNKTALSALCDITINNFTTPYTGGITFGTNPVFGDPFLIRDGLLMTHAALYDPALLKETKRQIVKAVDGNLVCETGDLIIGQFVNYYGDGNLTDGKTYKIKKVDGHKSHIITLIDPVDDSEAPLTSGTTHSIETPVPFIFPKDGDIPETNGYENAFAAPGSVQRHDGMFPYMYTDTGVLPAEAEIGGETTQVGYVDTAIDTTANSSTLQKQIDRLNLAYVGWVRDHVDPQYWSVYEYRVPRSRFSGDSLDGPFEADGETAKTRKAVYSDNVSGNRAGESYIVNDEQVLETSVWDYDFSKVTMLKIEFSWYGAVGALFLAYVPVGNGEARWVRVHHLRCSNQLKISSLGNATLPITYLVYGGGSENKFGLANADRANSGYNSSYSENLVKYGASYYIDGGDRGTVRLYNHSSIDPAKGDIDGSKYTLSVDSTAKLDDGITPTTQSTTNPYFVVDDSLAGKPALGTFYIGANVITGDPSDQDIKVIWVDNVNNYVYINKVTNGQPASIDIVVNRPKMLYGLKTKANIVSGDGDEVRNRVQVYPTKLSIGTTGTSAGKLTLLKTPLFQTTTSTAGTFTLTADTNLSETNLLTSDDASYILNDGEFTYGYFKGYLNDSSSFVKVLGKLERKNDLYYFFPYDVFTGKLVVTNGSEFVKDEIYNSDGTLVDHNINDFSKERLSSVFVSNVIQSPIPETGTSVATYYVNAGSQDYDLSAYFDYNKEYISFPLTDSIETLYLSVESQAAHTGAPLLNVSASVTWEEQ